MVPCTHYRFPHRLGLLHHSAVPNPHFLQSCSLSSFLRLYCHPSELLLVAMTSPWLVCYLSFHIWTHPHGSLVPFRLLSNQQRWLPPHSSKQACMGMTPDVVFIVRRLCPGTWIILWTPSTPWIGCLNAQTHIWIG